MAFHPGLPEGGKWILSSARCSWNGKHSVSRPQACLLQDSRLQPPLAQRRERDFTAPPALPSLAGRKKRGKRVGPAAGRLLFPDGDRQTLSASDTHCERCIRIPGMCDCPASPSVALNSITCHVPSVSPAAETLSRAPSPRIWSTRALWLSKYLSQAKGRHL